MVRVLTRMSFATHFRVRMSGSVFGDFATGALRRKNALADREAAGHDVTVAFTRRHNHQDPAPAGCWVFLVQVGPRYLRQESIAAPLFYRSAKKNPSRRNTRSPATKAGLSGATH